MRQTTYAAILIATALAVLPGRALAWNPFLKQNGDVKQGNRALHQGKPDDALKRYDDAQARHPNSADLQLNRGLAQLQRGDLDAANREFDTAIGNATSAAARASAQYNRGVSELVAAQRSQQGAGGFLSKLKPGSGEATTKHYKAAANSFRDALRNNPGDRDASFNLAYALKQLEQAQQQQEQEQEQEQQQDQQPPQDATPPSNPSEDATPQDQDAPPPSNPPPDSQQGPGDSDPPAQGTNPSTPPSNGGDSAEGAPQHGNATSPPDADLDAARTQQLLDALREHEQTFPMHRAQPRSRNQRRPAKDW